MTEYGLRCVYCAYIIKFEADFEGINKDDPGYGKLISKFNLTCPKCGNRDSYPVNDRIILGGQDAKVQTPKVIIDQAIEDLNWISVKDHPSWERLCDATDKLKRAKEKLPEF